MEIIVLLCAYNYYIITFYATYSGQADIDDDLDGQLEINHRQVKSKVALLYSSV